MVTDVMRLRIHRRHTINSLLTINQCLLKELFDLSAGFKPVTYHIKAESDSFLNAKQEKKELIPKLLIKVLGRIETRNYAVDTNIDWLDNKKRMEKHESVCNV